MTKLNVRYFGFAFGLTGAIFYIGCVIFMAVLGEKVSVMFFNSLMHGIDFSTIYRPEIPIWETLMGIVFTFVVCWIFGSMLAAIYNGNFRKRSE